MLSRRGRAAGGRVAVALLGLAVGIAIASAAFFQAFRTVPASVALMAPLPGDVDLDFRVDGADLAIATRYLRLSPLPPFPPRPPTSTAMAR